MIIIIIVIFKNYRFYWKETSQLFWRYKSISSLNWRELEKNDHCLLQSSYSVLRFAMSTLRNWMGPRRVLNIAERNLLHLLETEPRFLGRSVRSLVTIPTELSPLPRSIWYWGKDMASLDIDKKIYDIAKRIRNRYWHSVSTYLYRTNTVMLLREIMVTQCPHSPQDALVAGSTNSPDSWICQQ
jgi:hypothetical protein